MSGSNAKIEWYLARDGQQHGPLTDAELRKFIELGHLNASDLVWRAGFPEWRTASEVFPETHAEPGSPPGPTELKADDTQKPSEDRPAASSGEEMAVAARDAQPNPQVSGTSDTTEISRDPASAGGPAQAAPASPSPQPGDGGRDAQRVGAEPGPSILQSTPAPQRDRAAAGGHPQPHRSAPSPAPGPDGRAQPRPGAGQPQPPISMPAGGPAAHTGRANPNPAQPGGGEPNWQMPAGGQPGGGAAAGKSGFTAQAGPGSYPNQSGQPNQPYQQQQTAKPEPPTNAFDDDDFFDDYDSQPKRRPVLAAVVALMVFGVIGAGGWFAYANQETLVKIIADLTAETDSADPAVVAAPEKPARTAASTETAAKIASSQNVARTAPATENPARVQPAAATAAGSTGFGFFKGKVWQTFAQQYPDWVKDQESSVAKLRTEGRNSDEILSYVINEIVKWRRSNADSIMTASPDHLRSLAKTFVANLKYLVQQDVQACYGFISKGELSPAVLPFYGNSEQANVLGSQTEAIIAAAKNAGASKTTYAAPTPPDFNKLAQLLIKRGWTEGDLKMFSDPAALSSAPAAKVCKLVTEWFDTQLQMPPSDRQMRLLATSLQPVVRG